MTEQRRIDTVHVQLSGGKVVPLPWESREALLLEARLRDFRLWIVLCEP